jgi:hypothetical protein
MSRCVMHAAGQHETTCGKQSLPKDCCAAAKVAMLSSSRVAQLSIVCKRADQPSPGQHPGAVNSCSSWSIRMPMLLRLIYAGLEWF